MKIYGLPLTVMKMYGLPLTVMKMDGVETLARLELIIQHNNKGGTEENTGKNICNESRRVL